MSIEIDRRAVLATASCDLCHTEIARWTNEHEGAAKDGALERALERGAIVAKRFAPPQRGYLVCFDCTDAVVRAK